MNKVVCQIIAFFAICNFSINVDRASAAMPVGIHFENNQSWSEIKRIAKRQKKMIFVDLYTTWCVPCKNMAANVFTLKEVGDFFNQNFINVAVQMNKTAKDQPTTKAWYTTADIFRKSYQIDTYPTYLFFDENGLLVHKLIGATATADEFLSKSKMALNPATQYATLKKEFPARTDSAFLLTLINFAQTSNDLKSLPQYINTYLRTQRDISAAKNVPFLLTATQKSTDPGFQVLLSQSAKIDGISGRGRAHDLLVNIIFDENVLPLIRKDGKKTDYGGGMVVYSGNVIPDVDWNIVQQAVANKYPTLAVDVVLYARIIYDDWQNNFQRYADDVDAYLKKSGHLIFTNQLTAFGLRALSTVENKAQLQLIAGWLAEDASDPSPKMLLTQYAYAALLYKAGETDRATQYLKDIIGRYKTGDKYLEDLLAKIGKNEKVW